MKKKVWGGTLPDSLLHLFLHFDQKQDRNQYNDGKFAEKIGPSQNKLRKATYSRVILGSS